MNKIHILIVDDHAMIRQGLKLNIEEESDMHIIGEASNGQEAIDFVKAHQDIDIILMDITMPIMNGLEALKTIETLETPPSCLILSMHDNEEFITKSLANGAKGYLLKDGSSEELIKAIRVVHAGNRYYSTKVSQILAEQYLKTLTGEGNPKENLDKNKSPLSKRETEILKMIDNGLNNKEVSMHLKLSIRTVEVHRFNMMKKLKAKNVLELLKKARNNGLLMP
ncbi:MAG: DNA-binding response regulator [Flavobacteriaceae bacterium]|nr:MAG: DNA-binding response regulator [Flavobacteriaceae bacterium]